MIEQIDEIEKRVNGNLVQHYENELRKVNKQIEELWEVGKTSNAKQVRSREIELILDGLTAREQIARLNEKIKDYRKRLDMEGIEYE